MRADPIGIRGGINLYSYVANDPINSFDSNGLTREDVMAAYQHIIDNVSGIDTSKGWLYPLLPPVAFDSDLPNDRSDAYTETFWGRPVLPSEYLCNLSEEQFTAMYATLLHEMMHSTDSVRQRIKDAKDPNNPHHRSIFNRVTWEMGEVVSGTIISGTSSKDAVVKVAPMWGLPQQYVGGDLVNPNSLLPKIKELYNNTRGQKGANCECSF